MTALELLESLGTVKGKYVLEAHGEELPENRGNSFDDRFPTENGTVHAKKTHIRRRTRMKKGFWMAMIAATMLLLVGCVYAILKLQELSLGEYTYREPNPQNPKEKVTVTSEFISIQGLQDSPEYKATKEWQNFLHSYDSNGAILEEIGNGPTGLDNLSLLYQVYTQEMYDKLVEIADKYDLELHSEMNLVSKEEWDYLVGGSFTGEVISQGGGYIYENGTFQFDGEAMIEEKTVHLQFRRSVKGTLDETVLNIGSVGEYREIQYETACGETVWLELGKKHSMIYVDYDDCFLFLNVLAGSEEGFLEDKEGAISMEDLKVMADGIDFAILKTVSKPDMWGDLGKENAAPSSDETTEQTDADTATEEKNKENCQKSFRDGRMEAYQSLLWDVYQSQKFPGGRDLGYDGSSMSDNRFALEDIDRDGSEELLLLYTTTYVGGAAELIYDYDVTTGSVREQFVEFPAVIHFDNGILKADWSHNQGLAGRVWPYTLYQYNPESDTYEVIAMVDAWDKSLADKDYEGNPFPEQADKDGDLLVYYIMDADNDALKEPVDADVYEKWMEAYIGDAEVIKLSYMELTEENISKLQ